MKSTRSSRTRPARIVAATVLALLVFPQLLAAKSLTFGDPTADGKIKVAIYGARGDADDAESGSFEVTITAGMDAIAKATAIYNALHSHLANSQLVYAHSRSGATVTATSAVGGQEVWTVVSDNTQEGDIGSCSAGDHLYYTCSAPASGVAWDGIAPASITVGTNVHTTTVLTSPGQSPASVLNAAMGDLVANGVTNVSVAVMPNGVARLHIVAVPGDTQFIFGATDSGVDQSITWSSLPTLPAVSPGSVGALLVLLATAGSWILLWRARAASAGASRT